MLCMFKHRQLYQTSWHIETYIPKAGWSILYEWSRSRSMVKSTRQIICVKIRTEQSALYYLAFGEKSVYILYRTTLKRKLRLKNREMVCAHWASHRASQVLTLAVTMRTSRFLFVDCWSHIELSYKYSTSRKSLLFDTLTHPIVQTIDSTVSIQMLPTTRRHTVEVGVLNNHDQPPKYCD